MTTTTTTLTPLTIPDETRNYPHLTEQLTDFIPATILKDLGLTALIVFAIGTVLFIIHSRMKDYNTTGKLITSLMIFTLVPITGVISFSINHNHTIAAREEQYELTKKLIHHEPNRETINTIITDTGYSSDQICDNQDQDNHDTIYCDPEKTPEPHAHKHAPKETLTWDTDNTTHTITITNDYEYNETTKEITLIPQLTTTTEPAR